MFYCKVCPSACTERTAEVKRAASRIAAQGAAVYLANSSLMSLLASALVSWSSSSSSSASTLALTSVSICLAVALRPLPVSSPMVAITALLGAFEIPALETWPTQSRAL